MIAYAAQARVALRAKYAHLTDEQIVIRLAELEALPNLDNDLNEYLDLRRLSRPINTESPDEQLFRRSKARQWEAAAETMRRLTNNR